MAVFKDKWNGYKNTWRVSCYYENWKGERKRHDKRGFETKKEALAYEREFIAKRSKDINMNFDIFVNLYLADHIRPCFKLKSLSDISPSDILQCQNELLGKRDEQGKGYSPTFLRTIQNQLNAIFNHAVKYYDLPKNPCLANKKMGKAKAKEMLYWTKEEYLKFAEEMKEKPLKAFFCQDFS